MAQQSSMAGPSLRGEGAAARLPAYLTEDPIVGSECGVLELRSGELGPGGAGGGLDHMLRFLPALRAQPLSARVLEQAGPPFSWWSFFIPGAGERRQEVWKQKNFSKAREGEPGLLGKAVGLRAWPPRPSAKPTGVRSCLMGGDLFLQPLDIPGNWQMWHSSKEFGPQVPGSPAKCSCGSRGVASSSCPQTSPASPPGAGKRPREEWQMAQWS